MCWHVFGLWGPPKTVTVRVPIGGFGDSMVQQQVFQHRVCSKCGKIEARYVRDGEDSNG